MVLSKSILIGNEGGILRLIQVKRLLIVPLACAFLWLYIFENFSDSWMVAWVNEIFRVGLDYSLPKDTKVFVFGLGFGYLYSTFSLLIKARSFKGIPFFIFLGFKVLLVTFVTVFGVYFYFLELLLMPFIALSKRSFKRKNENKKRIKEKDERQSELEEFKKELIQELKEELTK
uniref:Uncharacterized protein n=1 Tax=Aeromonas sp. Ne-1 TaxID=1675689 RepID=A0A0H4J9K9_9GAMM|nr:hypothetical protein [Aeromonas sp. Ne-1]AKO69688.1 hypothetical protein [Aeromonas sp. Ne-1]